MYNESQQVVHTVKWYYGSYSGITTVVCDENDGNDVIKAKVKRLEKLNFLAMCSEGYKVIETRNYNA